MKRLRIYKWLSCGALSVAMSAVSIANAQQNSNETEARIQELERKLRETTETMMRELDALKQELKASKQREAEAAAKAEREAEQLKASAQRSNKDTEILNKELRETQAQLGDTREQLTTLQTRADSALPNVRLGDGFIIDDPKGRFSVRLTTRAHLDYRTFQEAGALADTFSIRRARVGLGFTAGKFGSFIETELTSGALGGANATTGPTPGSATNAILHQAYVDFNPYDQFRVRFGQFKAQFALENTTTSWNHDFQERSLAFALTQNFLFDRGLMFHGAPYNGTYYGVSIMNATGQNFDEIQRSNFDARADGKDVLVRLAANAAAWINKPDWIIHGGISYRTGQVANGAGGYVGPAAITEGRGLVFFAPEPFNNTTGTATAGKIQRTIEVVEGALAYRNYKLQTEYFRATYAGTRTLDDADFARSIYSGYVAFNWLITGEYFADSYRGAIFGRIRPNQNFGMNKGDGWGALELGLRYSFFDASSWGGNPANTGNAAATTALVRPTATPEVSNLTRKANAYTVALKWMPTEYWAFMMNYVNTEFDTPITANGLTINREQALTVRGQFNFF